MALLAPVSAIRTAGHHKAVILQPAGPSKRVEHATSAKVEAVRVTLRESASDPEQPYLAGHARLIATAIKETRTLGKATRHNMLVKAECSCGNVRYCRSADLMMVYGGGVDPLKLKFDCNRCKPDIRITLLEVHPEHLPKRLMIHKPMKVDGKITWYTERFRG